MILRRQRAATVGGVPGQSSEAAYVATSSSIFSLMYKMPQAYVQDQHRGHADTASHPAPTRHIVLSYALRGTEDVRMASVADVRPRVS